MRVPTRNSKSPMKELFARKTIERAKKRRLKVNMIGWTIATFLAWFILRPWYNVLNLAGIVIRSAPATISFAVSVIVDSTFDFLSCILSKSPFCFLALLTWSVSVSYPPSNWSKEKFFESETEGPSPIELKDGFWFISRGKIGEIDLNWETDFESCEASMAPSTLPITVYEVWFSA